MQRKWFRLDNAALIFPAVMRHNWNNAFRVSATLKEKIDVPTLEQAVKDIMNRFPTFFVRLKKGFFWYYLETMDNPPKVREDYAYPLAYMSRNEISKSCVRVLYYENRIAVEFFHSVTDGNGGTLFLLNLVARYLELRYNISVPKVSPLVEISEEPKESETQDDFLKCSGKFQAKHHMEKVYRLHGTPEPDFYRNLITGIVDTERLREVAHSYHSTVTIFLAAVLADEIKKMQDMERPLKKQDPVRITIPVNLRKLYHTETFRNFILTLEPGFDPRFGEMTFQELCDQMGHELRAKLTPQNMGAEIASNVVPQKTFLIRIVPLFIKNLTLRTVYAFRGENLGCLNVSNIGQVVLPKEMESYMDRLEFIIGVQYSYPNNLSMVSYKGKTFINMIRSIQESELERRFFSRLVEMGIPVEIESNQRG